MLNFPIRDNYALSELFDYSNLANGFEDQEWGELNDAHRWNPADFGEAPRQVEPSGQVLIFFDTTREPPEPDDYRSPEEFEQAWQQWEAKA
jgi:hypothetical protein